MSQGHPAYSHFVPQHGIIVGGDLDGWQYAIVRWHLARNGGVWPVVRAAEPGWPFPTEVLLSDTSYGRLQSIKGVRTQQVPVTIIKRAMRTNQSENLPWKK